MKYRGSDVVDKFIDDLIKLKDELLVVLRQSIPIDLSKKENQALRKATKCQFCTNIWGNMPFVIVVM